MDTEKRNMLSYIDYDVREAIEHPFPDTHTEIHLQLPNGAVRIRHKGTYLTIEREWDRHNTYLAVIPSSSGEVHVCLVAHPQEAPIALKEGS